MSFRYNAGINRPGYNALKVANAPTIGSATAGNALACVTFTAPSCTGGSVITTYTAYSNCGAYTATGASSPIQVTGLTNGTAYTFKVAANNIYGPSPSSASSNSVTPANIGSQSYTTPGTYSWVAPAGVTAVSVVAVGGGGLGCQSNIGSAGGSGGGLGYKNNYSVTPTNSYTVVVGRGATCSNYSAGCSYFVSTAVVKGGKGNSSTGCTSTAGGTYTGCGGGNGGAGGAGSYGPSYYQAGGGGGGAGGYSGSGGAGVCGGSGTGHSGSGGGGGGGGSNSASTCNGAGGGGVGLFGQGSSGAGGGACIGGYGGSGGAQGGTSGGCVHGSSGGNYGGAGGGHGHFGGSGGAGASGAVRIMWPGNTRSFPSTCAGSP